MQNRPQDQPTQNENPDQQRDQFQRHDQLALTPEEQDRVVEELARDESGLPGGGRGRIDVVEHTGVYPLSADAGASPDAQIEPETAWGQGERGTAGYEDSGSSEVIPPDRLGKDDDTI